MSPSSPGSDPDAPSSEPDKVPGEGNPVEDAARPNEREEAVNERVMRPNSPGSDSDAPSPEPDEAPGEDNPVEDTLCELRPLQRSNSEPSFALFFIEDLANLDPLVDNFRLDAETPDVSILVGDFSTESFVDHEERSEAALLGLPDEGSVFPEVVPDLPVARYPCPEDEDGQKAARLQVYIRAIENERNALEELIKENKTGANLTEEAKKNTKILKPKPADDDRKTAETPRSRPQMEARKKAATRGPYKCTACGNEKRDHICPLQLLVRRNEVGVQTAEGRTDDDQEILVGSDYEFCDDTETSEQNDSTEYDHDQQNHPKDAKRKSSETRKSSNNQESLPETGKGAGHNIDDADDAVAEESRCGIENIETADADTAEDTQSANHNDSDLGNPAKTNPEESASTPAKRKGDTDGASTLAKKSKNDKSQPQPEDSKETDSIGGPVEEEPPRNDQETIAANLRLELQVESDEEIVTVPV